MNGHELLTEETAQAILRQKRRNGRWLEAVFAAVLIGLVLIVVGFRADINERRETTMERTEQLDRLEQIAEDTIQTSEAIERATSPEAQRRSQERTAGIVEQVVSQIDCRQQVALRELVAALEETGQIRPGSVEFSCQAPG